MNKSITDNPAVLNPRKTLTPAQRDALCCIGFFRHARYAGGYWQIGRKRFMAETIYQLKTMKLVGGAISGPPFLTTAGQLAADKLKGSHP